MKSTARWSLLGFGVLAVLLMGLSQKATSYEYVVSTGIYEDASFTPEDQTSTYWEDASASGDADESTEICSCAVHTFAWAKGDWAHAQAHAQYSYEKHWVWNGPPGTTAPGGTFRWFQDGQGTEWAWTWSGPRTGSSYCSASVESLTWSYNGIVPNYTWANSSGDVTDVQNPTGGSTYGGSPWPFYFPDDDDGGAGWFDYSIRWATDPNGFESIASGTTQVHLLGGAVCDADSYASGTPSASDAEAESYTYGTAEVRLTGIFPY
jgi:hypothetical protein